MKTVKNIIFDLGGVLIDWNPEYVFLDVFDGDRKKMQWFFDEICTVDWNENQDAGYPLAQATADRIALFPQYEEWIKMFYGRWEEMLGGPIEETVALLKNWWIILITELWHLQIGVQKLFLLPCKSLSFYNGLKASLYRVPKKHVNLLRIFIKLP